MKTKLIIILTLISALVISLIGLTACNGNGNQPCPICNQYPSICEPSDNNQNAIINFNTNFVTSLVADLSQATTIGVLTRQQYHKLIAQSQTFVSASPLNNNQNGQGNQNNQGSQNNQGGNNNNQGNNSYLIIEHGGDRPLIERVVFTVNTSSIVVGENEYDYEEIITQQQMPAQINRAIVSRGFTFIQFVPLVEQSGYFNVNGEYIRVNLRPEGTVMGEEFDKGPFYSNPLSSSFIIENYTGEIFPIPEDIEILTIENDLIWMYGEYNDENWAWYEVYDWSLNRETGYLELSTGLKQTIFTNRLDPNHTKSRILNDLYAAAFRDRYGNIIINRYNGSSFQWGNLFSIGMHGVVRETAFLSDQGVFLMFREHTQQQTRQPPVVMSEEYTIDQLTFNSTSNINWYEIPIPQQVTEDFVLMRTQFRDGTYEKFKWSLTYSDWHRFINYKLIENELYIRHDWFRDNVYKVMIITDEYGYEEVIIDRLNDHSIWVSFWLNSGIWCICNNYYGVCVCELDRIHLFVYIEHYDLENNIFRTVHILFNYYTQEIWLEFEYFTATLDTDNIILTPLITE